jgi:hypothetical protein
MIITIPALLAVGFVFVAGGWGLFKFGYQLGYSDGVWSVKRNVLKFFTGDLMRAMAKEPVNIEESTPE